MSRQRTDQKIEELIKDRLYDIRPDGTIWTIKNRGGWEGWEYRSPEWRQTGLSIVKGYRTIGYNGVALRVARIIYRKFIGPLQIELVIDHIDGDSLNDSADNLQQITEQDNSWRGRKTKLTKNQVDEIRYRAARGENQVSLAKEFQISERTISHIVRRTRWID